MAKSLKVPMTYAIDFLGDVGVKMLDQHRARGCEGGKRSTAWSRDLRATTHGVPR